MRSPRFVKIWTTPFAASEPYKDEAAAPFTTSTRSMSSELMSDRPCRVIVPSTMSSGPGTSVEAQVAPPQADGDVSEVAERSRMLGDRSEEHTSELQSRPHLVCRLLLEKKKIKIAREP